MISFSNIHFLITPAGTFKSFYIWQFLKVEAEQFYRFFISLLFSFRIETLSEIEFFSPAWIAHQSKKPFLYSSIKWGSWRNGFRSKRSQEGEEVNGGETTSKDWSECWFENIGTAVGSTKPIEIATYSWTSAFKILHKFKLKYHLYSTC